MNGASKGWPGLGKGADICTELLYQPLTLLDCLHTFCGACLKEWFTFQAATAERSPNPPTPGANIFTCPSCRAPVRDTRHNATVVTLLDMLIAANPDKARSAAEKEEMAKKYKPGDQVLPKVNTHRTADERRAADEDRRLVEEVREMSLQEVGVSSSAPPRTRRRRESRSADDRSRSSRDRSMEGHHRRAGHRPRMEDGPRHSADQLHVEGERRHRRSESRQRQIEHQSSIRSLISSADMSERDIEREIEDFARQIQEEGLLDGLDLDNIDLSRDDELSRRITEAYRRRQRERMRQEATRRDNASSHTASTRYTESSTDPRMLAPDGNSRPRGRPRPHSRSTSAASAASAASQTEERSRPPTSMSSANLEVQDASRRPRRRTASGGRSATTPVFPTTTETRPATRSSTDLTLRSQTSDPTQHRPSFSEGRSTSTPIHTAPFPQPIDAAASTSTPSNLSFASRQGNTPNTSGPSQPPPSHPDTSAGRGNRARPTDLAIVHQAVTSPLSSPTVSGHQRTRSQLFPEPSISCARCNKPHIEYELHYNCSICAGGQWNMCIDCYRAGKGCLYWFGFGYGAWAKWEKTRQQQGDASLARPHMLTASRYRPPRSIPGGAEGRKTLTTDDPRNRLESGTFCAQCSAWTNECYWRCDVCNEGDWGFCNDCVNQGRSCSHTLLPLAHEAAQPIQGRPGSPPRSPGRPQAATIFKGPNAANIGPFKPLVFTTRCDVCQEPILPSQARYHCYHCTSSLVSDAAPGDYDICSSCYGSLVAQRQMSQENGHSGWRRCLNGHRMVVVGFADGKVGQWRYIAQDLVGGRGLRSEPASNPEHREKGLQKWVWQHGDQTSARLVTRDVSETAPMSDGSTTFTQSFPPDGGMGMKASARWGWYPKPGADDELLFPRGAEIKEIEDVNGDWYFGSYMGSRGLFPAPYVRPEQNPSSRLPSPLQMFRQSVRRLAATAAKAAEPSTHTIAVSQAQGVSRGLTGAIGNTPLIRLNHLSDETGCEILGKAEFMNPGGSIKDRAALYVVKDAEERGLLKPGGTVVEGTAGNTGIGLAHVCRSKGYKLVIYMPNTQSQGKIDLLRLLGAEVYPVPAVAFDNPENYNHQARRHAERLDNAVWTNQFDNTANRRAHIETTGPEIWAQTRGKVDAFTCATGTAGTLAGITRYLKDVSNGRVKSFLADPPGSVLHSYVSSGGKLNERTGSSITEGIGQGRITDNLQPDIDLLDGSLHIADEKSIEMVYRCLDEEGLYLGASSSLNVVAAKEVAEKLGKGNTVVTVLCDGAYRYADRLFSRKWLTDKKLLGAIPKHLEKYIVLP
ncbi:hypothetical protein FZEAL_4190 [Fusarium zealandicum]|uniref:Cysteine synthase 1 n=1 Tax=Fusarium zealandicum TaxID=1053134 RepID=A0A8H4XLU1_9HYPO|nr:hypothetical protein FZEAL_4190 [Fusarium zealandicum]